MKHTDGAPCAAENLQCSHLTQTYWSHQTPGQCARWATVRFGSTPLCWQHAEEYRLEERRRIAHAEVAELGGPVARSAAPADERRNRRRELKASVYFIQVVPGGPIKIGSAVDPAKRLRDLQTACPYELVLLAVSTRLDETKCHQQFADLRIRGEWFHPDELLLSFIAPLRPPSLAGAGQPESEVR